MLIIFCFRNRPGFNLQVNMDSLGVFVQMRLYFRQPAKRYMPLAIQAKGVISLFINCSILSQ